MTIGVNQSKEIFPVDVGQVYTFFKPYDNPDNLLVFEEIEVEIDGEISIKTTLVDSINYTIVTDGSLPLFTGGTLTFLVAHDEDAINVLVHRLTPITQLIDYVRYGAFPAETHEFGLDKLTLIMQDVGAQVPTDAVLVETFQYVNGLKSFRGGLGVSSTEALGSQPFFMAVQDDGDLLELLIYPFTIRDEASFSLTSKSAAAAYNLKGDENGELSWGGDTFSFGPPFGSSRMQFYVAPEDSGAKTLLWYIEDEEFDINILQVRLVKDLEFATYAEWKITYDAKMFLGMEGELVQIADEEGILLGSRDHELGGELKVLESGSVTFDTSGAGNIELSADSAGNLRWNGNIIANLAGPV